MANKASRRQKAWAEARAAKAHRMTRDKNGRIWGFNFPIGEKPWVRAG